MVAAPYVANILSEVLPYLGVERTYTEEELSKLAINLNSYRGWSIEEATKALGNLGLKYEVIGDGDQVQHQMPPGGSSLDRSSGKILLYTEDAAPEKTVTVPHCVGMNLTNATKVLIDAGLNICIKGPDNGSAGAEIVAQDIAHSTLVERGTVITLILRYLDGTAN